MENDITQQAFIIQQTITQEKSYIEYGLFLMPNIHLMMTIADQFCGNQH